MDGRVGEGKEHVTDNTSICEETVHEVLSGLRVLPSCRSLSSGICLEGNLQTLGQLLGLEVEQAADRSHAACSKSRLEVVRLFTHQPLNLWGWCVLLPSCQTVPQVIICRQGRRKE